MLNTKKSVTLSGTSTIDGTPVANMYASMTEDGGFSTNVSVANRELYAAHGDEVQADIAAFGTLAYALLSE